MVTTLPITPRSSAPFQTLLSVFVAWLYASFSKDSAFMALNLAGQRLRGIDLAGKVALRNQYSGYCTRLGLTGLRTWSDDDPDYARHVSESLGDLRTQRLLSDKLVSILVCRCGAVEILGGTPLLSVGATTYTVHESGTLICKLCGGVATEEKVRSLLFHAPVISPEDIFFYPLWVRKEIREMITKFGNAEVLVSRTNRMAAPLIEAESGLAVDSDFFWSMFVSYLGRSAAEEPIVLVTSHRTIRYAFQVAMVSRSVGCRQPISVIVNPTFEFRNKNGDAVPLAIEQFCGSGDPEMLKYLLTLSLQWRSKESTVETAGLYWISHSIRPKKVYFVKGTEPLAQGIEEFCRVCCQGTARRLIAKLRKMESLDARENRLRELLQDNNIKDSGVSGAIV